MFVKSKQINTIVSRAGRLAYCVVEAQCKLQQVNIMATFSEIAHLVILNGGHTEFTPSANHLLEQWEGKGYLVAESKDLEVKLWMGNVDGEEVLIGFIADALAFFHSYNSDANVGAWIDGDYLYLDRVQVVRDLDTALQLGRERQQLSIYSIHEDKVYDVEEMLAQNSENGTDGNG